MKKRRSKRIDFQLKAETTLGNVNHKGTIENFSQEGMMQVIPNGQLLNILPRSIIQVSFETPSGEYIMIECEIRWIRHYSNLPFGVKHHIGMEINNPSKKYTEFVHGLYSIHSSTAVAGFA